MALLVSFEAVPAAGMRGTEAAPEKVGTAEYGGMIFDLCRGGTAAAVFFVRRKRA